MKNKEKYIKTIELLKTIYKKLKLSFYEISDFKITKSYENISILIESFGSNYTSMTLTENLGSINSKIINFHLFEITDTMYYTELYDTLTSKKIDIETILNVNVNDFDIDCYILEHGRLPNALLNLNHKEIIRELIS